MSTTTIVFDLGGVLIDWDPRYLYRQVFATEAEMAYFLAHVATSDWNEAQDGGRPLAEATAWLSARHPRYAREIELFYGRWEEMLGGPIHDTVAVLDELRQQARYPLYALTNWSAETWPVAWQRYEFLQWFAGILVSGQEGMRKPDPRIYHLLAERFGFSLGEALFIDDNARNVAAAQAVGLPAVLFTDATSLRRQLQERGLL